MTEHGLDGLSYGHFGDGCVHIRIDFPFSSAPGRYRRFVVAAAQLVGKYGGSMSGEHGDGRARSELLPAMYSPEAIEVMAAVKAIFDPGNVLNPGVLVDPAPLDADLRVPQARPLAPRARLRLLPRRRRPVRRGAPLRRGGQVPGRHHRQRGRDVPVLPGHPGREGLHPRPRAGAAGAGQRQPGHAASRSAEVAESLDLCLSCKGCSSDCPAGVDMATYKAEVLYQRYRRRPRPPAHYSLGWLPRWARLASRAPGLANAALRAPGLAGLAKRLGGIDARRPLPRFAAQTFRAWFAARPGAGVSSARDAGAAVGGHVHRLLHPRGRPGRRAGARGGRVRGADHGRAGVLRADLDLHRPARRRPPAAAAQPAGSGPRAGRRHPGRRPRALVHRRAARRDHRAAAGRPARLPGQGRHPHAGRAAGRHRRLGAARPRRRARGGPAALPPPRRDGLARRLRAAGPGRRRGHRGRRLLRAWPATSASSAATTTSRRPSPRPPCCPPSARPGDAVVLADGFSCRTQLDQLAGVSGTHLAQLLASRLADPPA